MSHPSRSLSFSDEDQVDTIKQTIEYLRDQNGNIETGKKLGQSLLKEHNNRKPLHFFASKLAQAILLRLRLKALYLPLIEMSERDKWESIPSCDAYKSRGDDEEVMYKVLKDIFDNIPLSLRKDASRQQNSGEKLIFELECWAKTSSIGSDDEPTRVLPLKGFTFIVDEEEQMVDLVLCSPIGEFALFSSTIWAPRDIRDLLLDLAYGLKYIHDKGVVHGPIYPGSVVLYSGHFCWVDFELSKFATHRTVFSLKDDTRMSIIRKNSPETALDGVGRGIESDIYEFANLIYEAVTRCPATGELFNNGHPTRPREMKDHDWDPLWELMSFCWNDDPKKRPNDAELITKIQSWEPQDNDEGTLFDEL